MVHQFNRHAHSRQWRPEFVGSTPEHVLLGFDQFFEAIRRMIKAQRQCRNFILAAYPGSGAQVSLTKGIHLLLQMLQPASESFGQWIGNNTQPGEHQ